MTTSNVFDSETDPADHEALVLHAAIGTPDGRRLLRAQHTGSYADPEGLGRAMAQQLWAQGAQDILAACIPGTPDR